MDVPAVKVPVKASEAPKADGQKLLPPTTSGPSTRRGSLVPPDEPGRRASLIVSNDKNRKLRPGEVAEDKRRGSSINIQDVVNKINQPSTPLRDIGEIGPPQIVDMYDSYSAVEDTTGYISVQVKGTPAPTFKFYYKGVTPLIEGVRYKILTDGETNTITLCMRKVKSSDEGKYKIVITNCHGTVSDETQMYVSKAGCTDFRALLRKSKYAQWGLDKGDPNWGDLKGVEKPKDQFLSPLQDKTVKEGKDKKVEFEAKFSKPNAKPKWFYRQNELFMGVKYKFKIDGDIYHLTVLNPKLADSGKYTIDIGGVQSSAVLTVEAPDPSYKFIRPLNKKYDGFTKHELVLECKVNDPIAIVTWYKGDKKLSSDNQYVIDKDLSGVCTLTIKSCDLNDAGDYRCQLERQPDKTETKVKVVEYPYKFTKLLRSQQNVEKDTVTLCCELDDPLGEVKWFKDGKEIKPDGKGIQLVTDGRKRKLIIKDAKLSDAGQYSCSSNADKTQAELNIKKKNQFNKKLKDTVCVEREKLVLEVELEDETAPAEWKFNGKPIKPSDRIEIKNLGGGKHQLIFNNLKVADAGEVSVVSGDLTSSCKLTVQKGETKPQINAPNEFEGPINAPIVIEVPYKIEGKKQTPIEGMLLKDGKSLPSKDVQVQVKDDKVIFKINKPTRDQSGPYQIKLSNGQGADVKDIKITMQDVSTAPQDVNVRDVFEKSCIIDWKPPKDNGGTPLQKYVIERQDISSKKGGWESVGEIPADKPTTYKVEGLTPKKTYRLRIRAVNKIGSSEPAEFKKDVLAKDPWDEPSKPKNVEVTDWDKDHADLKWTKPDTDGGAPITEYEIEVKDKFSKDWVKKKRVPASQTSTTVNDLKEGQTYEFRVRAVNKAGPGEASDATKPIVAKCRFVKPFITGDQLKTIIIKKGQEFKYDVRFGGEPEPEVKWEKDGKELKVDGKRITCEKPERNTILTVRNGVRSDSGKYKLILTNSSGKIESVGEVIVLDKPSPPKGPLVAEEVRADHVKVKWQKPEDTGGCELTGYVLEKMDADGGKWVPAGECGPNDLTFTFNGLTPNKKYKFRVRAKNKEGVSEPLETTNAILAKNPYDAPSKPGEPDIVDYDNVSATLNWGKPEKDGGRPITHYTVEIKSNKSKEWKEVLKTSDDKCKAIVDGLTEGMSYQFRVRAHNKGGASEPSESTKSHTCKYKDLKPHIDRNTFKSMILKAGRNHMWSVDVTGEPAPEMIWSLGDGKPLASSEYIIIENKEYHTNFTINNAHRKDSGKYKLKATNRSGSDEETVELIVLGPPSAPKGPLEVTDINDKGCKLKWKKPDDHGGVPLRKYKIEKRDPKSPIPGKWLAVGTLPISVEDQAKDDLEFVVTGLTPNSEWKFRVTAINDEGESAPLETTKCIVCKHKNLKPCIDRKTFKTVTIKAGRTHKWSVDVAGVPVPEMSWSWVDNDPDDDTEYVIEDRDNHTDFTITNVQRSDMGKYTLKATNCVGSDEETVNLIVLAPPTAPNGPLEASNIHDKGCKLKWKKPDDDGGVPIRHYNIEKLDTKCSDKWVSVGKVSVSEKTKDTLEFDVTGLNSGSEYKFRVTAVNDEGTSQSLVTDMPIKTGAKGSSEIAVDSYEFEQKGGSSESGGSNSKTTVTTMTEKVHINDGGRVRTQTRTTIKNVTRSRTAAQTEETFEEFEVDL